MSAIAKAGATAAFLAVAALGTAGVAQATPTGGGNAADTMQQLEELGYDVQVNGGVYAPLERCTVTRVHAPGNHELGDFNNAQITVSCPGDV